VKRGSYLFTAFSIGDWTVDTCREMIETLSYRTETPLLCDPIEVFTDGNDDYVTALPDYYWAGYINYGQLIKIRQKGRVVGKVKKIIYGNPILEDIETTDVENFDGILRERVGRLVRKTKCVSKKKRRLTDAINLFQFYWNFINEFERDKSPAMIEGLTDHVWNWGEFFRFRLTIVN
jgi:hypothetical protein